MLDVEDLSYGFVVLGVNEAPGFGSEVVKGVKAEAQWTWFSYHLVFACPDTIDLTSYN